MTPTSSATNLVTTQLAPCSPPSWLRPLLLGVTLIFILVLGINTVFRAGPYTIGGKAWGSPAHRTDLTVYTEAGRAVLHGTDIYQAHNVRGWYYIYPPPFAIAIIPIALLPTFWAALVWYLLSVLLIGWALKMSVELVSDALHFDRDPLWLYTLPPVLVLLPLVSGLARGQASPVLLWLIIAGLFYGWKRQDWRGGICFAGGILLKVFPVILLAYFVWRKRWRFVIATLAATAIGAFILPAAVYGWHRNITYLREWVDVIGKPALETESERTDNPLYAQLLSSQLPRNQSLPAVFTRIVGNPQARLVGIGIGMAMAAIMLAVGWHADTRREIHILSAAVVWMLLVPPVSWSHYFPLLFLPLAALIAVATTHEAGSGRRVARAVLVVFGILSLTVAGIRAAQVYGPLCWGTLALWVALMVCARHASAPSVRREKV